MSIIIGNLVSYPVPITDLTRIIRGDVERARQYAEEANDAKSQLTDTEVALTEFLTELRTLIDQVSFASEDNNKTQTLTALDNLLEVLAEDEEEEEEYPNGVK